MERDKSQILLFIGCYKHIMNYTDDVLFARLRHAVYTLLHSLT